MLFKINLIRNNYFYSVGIMIFYYELGLKDDILRVVCVIILVSYLFIEFDRIISI